MKIGRNDGDERQTRVDHMIEEFRQAQSRRLAKAVAMKDPGDQGEEEEVVELPRDVHAQAAADGSMTTPRTSY